MAVTAESLAPSSRRSRSLRSRWPSAVDAEPAQLDAGLLGQHEPGDDVGVVLHLGEHDGVAGAEVGLAPGLGHQVQALGDVLGEDHAPVGGGADEAGHLAPGLLHERGWPPRRWRRRPGARWRGSSRSSGPSCRARPGASGTTRPSRGSRSACRGPRGPAGGSPCGWPCGSRVMPPRSPRSPRPRGGRPAPCPPRR